MASMHPGDRAYVAGDGRTGTYLKRVGNKALIAMRGDPPRLYPFGWVTCPDRPRATDL